MKNNLLVRLHVKIMDVFVSWSSINFTSSPQQEEELRRMYNKQFSKGSGWSFEAKPTVAPIYRPRTGTCRTNMKIVSEETREGQIKDKVKDRQIAKLIELEMNSQESQI